MSAHVNDPSHPPGEDLTISYATFQLTDEEPLAYGICYPAKITLKYLHSHFEGRHESE